MAQKRSENTYQKIETIFKRDSNNIIMPYSGFVYPELEWLRNCKFDATEKIDGTNIRIEAKKTIISDESGIDSVRYDVSYKGKTDAATIPALLLKFLETTYPEEKVLASLGIEKLITPEHFSEHRWMSADDAPDIYTIYGEGYGKGIQKGGNYIRDGVGFIVFDVKVNDIYLLDANMKAIAEKLGAPVVPYMGQMTIDEAIEFVKKGFKSTIAENKDYDAEGLVLKSPHGIRTRMGQRIIFKIKTCDFAKRKAKYGTDGPCEQPENELYNKK